MIASERRNGDISSRTNMSNMSFEENSWKDFSNSRDEKPMKPKRDRTVSRKSHCETSSNQGFGTASADGFDNYFGSDVFGSDVLAADPWGDYSGHLNGELHDFNKSESDNREATSRTMDMTDSSDNEDIFEANFPSDFTVGTMPLRDPKEIKTERNR